MATAAARQTGGSVRVTLWILLIVYIFNFIDRQIVNILAEPIRMELGLSDTQVEDIFWNNAQHVFGDHMDKPG